MERLAMETENITDKNIQKILELFPNVATEAKDENGRLKTAIDFEKLKQELSEDIVDGQENYEFTWVGKREAMIEANRPIRKTLRPDRESSVNWDTTENIYIEGDNLDALKLLQESYMGKIKMIYIDPPYNTGKDFVYRDNFAQDKESYDDELGIKDENNNKLFQNTEANGRFHSDWCSMIYPRLKLARNLLSDDGVIFISIDDNEVDNLKKICDEVFGSENRLETFHIQVRYDNKSLNEKDNFQKLIEYTFIYAKDKKKFIPKKAGTSYDLSKFCYKIVELENGKTIELGGKKVHILKEGQYKLEKVDTCGIGYLKATWASGSILKGNTSGKFFDKQLSIRKDIDGLNVLYKVEGIGEDGLGYRYFTGPKKLDATQGQFYSGVPLDRIEQIKKGEAIKYNPIVNYYDYSGDFGNIRHEGGIPFNSGKKPIKMLKELIKICNLEQNDIILDFFSGSSSTAHACIQYNLENYTNYKFIMVQLPENNGLSNFDNICELAKQRIRNVGNKIQAENPDKKIDIGFRVFKVDDTNMKDVYYAPNETVQKQLGMFESNIKDDRTDEDLLYGCLLDWGVELSLPHKIEIIDGKRVHIVDNDALVACFEDNIPDSVVKKIAEMKPLRVVFRDSSFVSDDNKINVEEIFKLITPDTSVKVI